VPSGWPRPGPGMNSQASWTGIREFDSHFWLYVELLQANLHWLGRGRRTRAPLFRGMRVGNSRALSLTRLWGGGSGLGCRFLSPFFSRLFTGGLACKAVGSRRPSSCTADRTVCRLGRVPAFPAPVTAIAAINRVGSRTRERVPSPGI
jgi:hypothetical protein